MRIIKKTNYFTRRPGVASWKVSPFIIRRKGHPHILQNRYSFEETMLDRNRLRGENLELRKELESVKKENKSLSIVCEKLKHIVIGTHKNCEDILRNIGGIVDIDSESSNESLHARRTV
ncbi:hypothetical protein ACP275_10G104300 [Erythranthe tilingii]